MKRKISNPANNFSLTDKFLQQTGQPLPAANDTVSHEPPVDVDEGKPGLDQRTKDSDWDRWTIICRKEFKQKITAISEKEGFTIREIVEKFFTDGIAAYEAKHGMIDTTLKKKKNIDNLT